MIIDLLTPTLTICLVVCGLAAAHIAFLRLLRALAVQYSPSVEALGLGLLTLIGIPVVWDVVPWAMHGADANLTLIQIAATAFYGAGCIVYLEVRSLMSRGYSLRILTDLAACDAGVARKACLKTNYGGGVGIRGLLDRRVRTLERLGLVAFDGKTVGPLTSAGNVIAVAVVGFRRLFRLDLVG